MRKIFTFLAAAAMVAPVGAKSFDWTYQVTPEEGTVNEISQIRMTFPEIDEIDVTQSGEIVLSLNGERIKGYKVKTEGKQTVTITPTETLVTPGVYTLLIPEASLCAYDSEYNDQDNPDSFALTWTIEQAAGSLDFTCESSLPTNEYIAYFGELTLTFPELESVSYAGTGLTVSKNGETIEDVTVTSDANKLTLTLKDALNFVDATVDVAFAPESLTGVAGGVTATNNEEVKLSYKMANPVEYDLQLFINTPKPNADGQISAEKSLESFFFYSETKGLLAAAGTEANVTIKEVNGDYEASGRLKKANGLNSNYSYFSVSFNTEPQYNGIYTITIDKGAIGDEAWVSDPNYGHSNNEIQFNFELVDGADRGTYTLKPTSLEFGHSYEDFTNYAIIKIKFEEGIEAVPGAKATMAGIDNSYSETVEFVKDELLGGYKARFVYDEYGRYMFSIDKGMFGDADFIATGNGLANAPISEEKLYDVAIGVNVVKSDSDNKEVFNLQGIRINSDVESLPAGLYIIGGKKINIAK